MHQAVWVVMHNGNLEGVFDNEDLANSVVQGYIDNSRKLREAFKHAYHLADNRSSRLSNHSPALDYTVVKRLMNARDKADQDRMEKENLDEAYKVISTHACMGCGENIDPDTCYCGIPIKDHNFFDDGHSGVPMGCKCFYGDNDEISSVG